MKRLRARAVWFFGLLATLFLVSCATPPPASSSSSLSAGRQAAAGAQAAPEARPGLGTSWGETRESQVTATGFRRADFGRPLATAAIHYNDAAGIRAMVGAVQPRRTRPALSDAAGNLITVEIRDEAGGLLPGLTVAGHWFVVGESGRRYAISVRNHSDSRLEVVLSVDGLDVIDGRPASYRKRGYIVEAGRRLVVEGFRRSRAAVAAFRFGSVSDSYANRKYGDTRNVGVIGIALFHEFGTDPYALDEAERRLRADPFPGRFATPPEPIPVRPPLRRP